MAYPVFHRNISERADFFDMVSEMSIQVTYHLEFFILTDDKIQQIAQEILVDPQFSNIANKEKLMDQIKHHALQHRDEFSQLSKRLAQKTPNNYLNRMYQCIEIIMMKSFRFEIVKLTEDLIAKFIKLNKPIKELSCFEFAMARAGVQEIFSVFWTYDDLLGLLREWGFRTILEKSKPGDLVVFLKDGIPLHMGIRYKDGILSKPGNGRRFAYIHKLEEASRIYGDQVLFFRRAILN